AIEKKNWALAERQLRIVVKEAPNMADAWHYLGEVLLHLNRPEDAVQAYESAARIDPKQISARIGLLRAYLDLKKWREADAVADALIQQQADVRYPEIHTHRAIALFNLGEPAAAEKSVLEGIRRDTKHQVPRSEMILGTILEARADYDGART